MMSFQRDPMRVTSLAMVAAATLAIFTSSDSAVAAQFPSADGDSPQSELMEGASTWKIDNDHSSLVCAASHFGLSFIYGRLNSCSGTVKMNFQEPDKSTFRFTVDPDSIDTNNTIRDIQLRSDICLDTKQYDSISFESVEVKAKDTEVSGKKKRTFQVTGNLSLHGETRKLTIPVELLAMGNGVDEKLRCGFMSRFVVSRSAFGLDAMADTIGDNIAVTFCFQAVQQEKPATEEEPKASRFKEASEDDGSLSAKAKQKKLEKLFSPKTPDAPAESPFDEPDGDDSSDEIDLFR